MAQQSAACCSVPPVQAQYTPKGEYGTVDGLKTYQTGDASAKHGIFVVYDIFGFYPQTLQGADILAFGDKERPYRVFMPDFFEGSPADISWYPPDNKDKEEKLGKFFSTAAAPSRVLPKLQSVLSELKNSNPNITSWGILGYCWGGKIANLSSKSGTPFKAAASAHPAMVDPSDAADIAIPYILLASKDEDKEAVSKWKSACKTTNVVETFNDQIHGWMAARSDLSDPNVQKEYERGYKLLLDFYHQHL